MKQRWLLLCLITFMLSSIVSATSKIEGVFAPKILDAKVIAWGGAGAAYTSGPEAILLNPARLAAAEKAQISITQVSLLEGLLPTSYLGFCLPTRLGSFGFATTKIAPAFTDFTYNEREDVLTWAKGIGGFSLGTNLKILKLEGLLAGNGSDFSAQGYSLDFGAVWEGDNMSSALVVQNFANKLTGENYNPDAIPLSVRTGFLYSYDPTTKFIVDITDLTAKPAYHVGIEKSLSKELSLRLGYEKGALSAGLGFAYRKIKIDYSYIVSETQQSGFLTWGLKL